MQFQPCTTNPHAVLKAIWGYDRFREPQEEIVRSLVQGQDALILMPTGGGKSLCFQIPALLRPGLTLVVSPLVALMENQVQELQDQKVPAGLLHSQLSREQRRQVLLDLERRSLKLLYLSPETLLSPPVWERLNHPDLPISSLVLDEAHCVAQWGETFRPAYFRLGAVRDALQTAKSASTPINVAAFTATANPEAQATIQTILRLRNPVVFKLNPYRSNLNLQIQWVITPRGRRQQLWKFIQQQSPAAGLVYVRTRQDSEKLAAELRRSGYATAAYHAGLAAQERRKIEQAWLTDRLQFVVCTNAFGMGVNKPNVRWVAHFHAPLLLSEYIQEVGRAGRDGKTATALLLASEPTGWLDGSDRQRWQFFQQQLEKQADQAKRLLKHIPSEGSAPDLFQQYPQADVALSILQAAGGLHWRDPFHYQLTDQRSFKSVSSQSKPEIAAYLKTKDCRWKFLLAAFGFSQPENWHCGHCDRCQPR
ncbi:ATP-dependent DNA helicase RecQ [Alkalinema sp. FACHB-956]|uniref:RecQ family ATP-dependent DNA helicase n=1 Tax=Alkalinema sp. FACHB-956 TaxID=2692768 RepID=UPI00168286DA|nr:ATP-dependent DNA helicase RecQ [Alkalinema sp. FACHB-956]